MRWAGDAESTCTEVDRGHSMVPRLEGAEQVEPCMGTAAARMHTEAWGARAYSTEELAWAAELPLHLQEDGHLHCGGR